MEESITWLSDSLFGDICARSARYPVQTNSKGVVVEEVGTQLGARTDSRVVPLHQRGMQICGLKKARGSANDPRRYATTAVRARRGGKHQGQRKNRFMLRNMSKQNVTRTF